MRHFPPFLILLPASCASAALLLFSSCFGGPGDRALGLGGSVTQIPGRDGHGFGGPGDLYLVSAVHGRLVTVLDLDGQVMATDILIRAGVRSDGVNYDLSRNLVTTEESLRILHPAGSAAFEQYLTAAQSGLPPIAVRGLGSPPPFTTLPRNAAIRLEFSDQIDPATVDETTIQVMTGEPPTQAHPVRFVVQNDLSVRRGYVTIDPTISNRQSSTVGLPANMIGLPGVEDPAAPNISIRIPTVVEPAFGQFEVVRDLGHTRTVAPQVGDPIETTLGGAPVVIRAARAGGFLEDHGSPSLVGEFDCNVSAVSSPQPWLRRITWSLDAAACQAVGPRVGDVLESATGLLLLTQVLNGTNPAAYEAEFALIEGSFPSTGSGIRLPGRISTRYDQRDEALQACYLRFTPQPSVALPARGLDPFSSALLKFDEPMDEQYMDTFETCVPLSFIFDPNSSSNDPARQFDPNQETVGGFIDRLPGYGAFGLGNPNLTGSGRLKFGTAELDAEARLLTVTPAAGWSDAHNEGTGIRLALALRDRADGLKDLAGNPLAFTDFVAGNHGQQEPLELDPGVPWPTDRYFALRFNSTDENGDSYREYGGQFTFSTPGSLRGRQLNRFSRNADPMNPFIAQRIQFSRGLVDPLTPTGAVMMGVFPYHLLGLGLSASAEFNLDVEGMAWSPFNGVVFPDNFHRYSLALAHSNRFPDDYISPSSGYPSWPNSGLRRNSDFDDNILGFPGVDEVLVADGAYDLTPGDLFTSTSGRPYLPWQHLDRSYTWRDTGIPPNLTGGDLGAGVPPDTIGLGNKLYAAGALPSVALPLLARFRCYPRGNFFGTNGAQVQLMVGSSALPAFRVFSSGGRDAGGNWHQVIPDDRGSGGLDPQGGYSTTTGARTKAYGAELYWHQVDFVLRISRVYTHWFTFGGTLDSFTAPMMRPELAALPPGTAVELEFRGSDLVTQTYCSGYGPLTAADVLDAYGDLEPGACGNVNAPGPWTTDLQDLLGMARFFQMRFTFVSNIELDLEPELQALGFCWTIP